LEGVEERWRLEVRGSRHLKPPEARREVEVKVKVEWEANSGLSTLERD
jgi:hypothetical protein